MSKVSRRSFLIASGGLAAATAGVLRFAGENGIEARAGRVGSENQRAGSGGWRIEKEQRDDDPRVRGFASAASVIAGQKLALYVDSPRSRPTTAEFYRMGYYGGAGGRLVHSAQVGDRAQPKPEIDSKTGLIQTNWQKSYELSVPGDWVSGAYLAKLTTDEGFGAYVPFVVRDNERAALMVQLPEFTDQAYNNWPNTDSLGKSLYDHSSVGPNTVVERTRAVTVSFDRPLPKDGAGQFFDWNYYMIRWLEREGYDLTYSANIDTHQNPDRMKRHKAFISIGHDEYWTERMRRGLVSARDAGVHLAFFGANNVYWHSRLESNDRHLTCYKKANFDPEPDASMKTARFREVGRPEQSIFGVMYETFGGLGLGDHTPIVYQNTDSWAFKGTNASNGEKGPKIIGYEIDRFFPDVSDRLPSQKFLAASPFKNNKGATATQQTSLAKSPAGSWIFAAGTMAWAWGLDRDGVKDPKLQRLTKNILDEFAGGGNAGPDDEAEDEETTGTEADSAAPAVAVVEPAQGGVLQPGETTIRGTVSDPSTITALTVSLLNADGAFLQSDDKGFADAEHTLDVAVGDQNDDGKATWELAVPELAPGAYTIKVRATDEHDNQGGSEESTFRVASPDLGPLTIAIAELADGATTGTGPLRIRANVTGTNDPETRVEVVLRNQQNGRYTGDAGSSSTMAALAASAEGGEDGDSGERPTVWATAELNLEAGVYYTVARVVAPDGAETWSETVRFTATSS